MTHQESSNGLQVAFEQPLIKFLMSFENIMRNLLQTVHTEFSLVNLSVVLAALAFKTFFELWGLYVASKFPLKVSLTIFWIWWSISRLL